MKKLAFVLISTLLFSSLVFAGDVWVNGYTRSNGTYVKGYYRTRPNQYRYDNFSSRRNINPYTGQKGYKRNEFSSPPAYNKNYGGFSGYNSKPTSSWTNPYKYNRRQKKSSYGFGQPKR